MRKLVIGTVQFLKVRITANVDLDEQTVQFSFDKEEWHNAIWQDEIGTTRVAALLVGTEEVPLPEHGTTNLYVRIADSPETPVISVGRLSIV